MSRALLVLALLLAACASASRSTRGGTTAVATTDAGNARERSDGSGADAPESASGSTSGSSALGSQDLPATSRDEPRRGSLPRTAIRQVVVGAAERMRECYETNVPQGTRGRVMIAFIIGPSGAVQSAFIRRESTTLDVGALHACMLGVVRRLSFPQPEGGGVVGVNYPWTFGMSDLRTRIVEVRLPSEAGASVELVERELGAHVGRVVDCFDGPERAAELAAARRGVLLRFEMTAHRRAISATRLQDPPAELVAVQPCLEAAFEGHDFEVGSSAPLAIELDLRVEEW